MTTRVRIGRIAVVVLAGLALVAGLVGPADAQPRFKVRVGAITQDAVDTLGPYAALKEGYFQQEGIEPILSYNINGPVTLQKMVAGDVDVAISTAIAPFFQAVASGVDLVWVASTAKNNSPLVVRKEIKSVKELEGKRLGTPGIGTIHDTLLSVFEKRHGIKTQHVYGRISDLLTYLERGEIDGLIAWQPPAELARKKLGAVYLAKAVIPGAESLGIIFPREFVKKNPEVVKRFVKAHLRGIQYFKKQPEALARWLAEREKLDLDVVRNIALDRDMILGEDPVTDRPSTKIIIAAARDAGKIPKALIPDDRAIEAWMDKHIDESYLREAMKELEWK
ncbi:MAG TPA: ABC transporter substrate-binding protein [Methylomirabilota bacterium]|jgi:NitT/TauT family transport system substrate-binding protein